MRSTAKNLAATVLLSSVLFGSGCATIVGTAGSPITGGVDLSRYYLDRSGYWFLTPFVFVAGAVGGPFAALWNGVSLDTRAWPWSAAFQSQFPQIFRPYEMLDRGRVVKEERAK